MRIRDRLTYANVASTLALVLVIGGGGAYAAGFIDSGDIVNNSIESRDLENRDAVKARDVRKNGLTGREIKEKTLDAAQFAPLAGQAGKLAVTPSPARFFPCVNTPIRLRSPGRVTGGCHRRVRDADRRRPSAMPDLRERAPSDAVATPGENGADEDSFAVTLVTNRLARGSAPDLPPLRRRMRTGQLASSSIAVIGISG